MSNQRKIGPNLNEMMSQAELIGVPRWQIRIRSEQPTLIEDSEIMREYTMRPVMERAYILSRRTSYMVNGPNREVWVAIDRWNSRKGEWQTIFEAKTKLREGASAL